MARKRLQGARGMNQLPVLIVGGGIGGMTLALALAKNNIASCVLEQADHLRAEGSGIQFCPNTFKVLDYLGIADRFEKVAFFPDFLCYRDGISGKEFIRLPLGDKIVERFNYPFGSFKRDEMLMAFLSACKEEPLVQFETDAKVIQIEEYANKVVAKTSKGGVFEGSLLVGSDGIWSIVRKYVLGEDKPRISGQIIYRGIVDRNQMPSHLDLDSIVHYVKPSAHLVHYPIGKHNFINISAIFQADRIPDYRECKGNEEELLKWFEGGNDDVLDILSHVDKNRMWCLCDYEPSRNWSKGRVVLLGDSIHATLPYMTSGAGMAVEDAVVLSQMLDKYEDYSTAFKKYEEERYLRTSYVQYFSRAYGEAHHSSGVAREIRNQYLSNWSTDETYNWVSFLYSGIHLTKEAV